MERRYITVTTLNKYLKNKFDTDPNIQTLGLKGEISNFKGHTRGHLYFTLKDEGSRINAVMFSTYASKLNFVPKDGMKVLVVGRVSVYEPTGGYQIYVNEMISDGVGNLYLKFEELKKKLSNEGLFNQEHKRPIPKFPKKIGIVTAPTGAAIRDILSTIKRRFPSTETILFPALVQGDLAAPDIVKQIKKADEYNLDVLIVGRGGGSIEDLWAFNEEIVARAIYDAKTPIISAVGHEIDFTISDFVSDLRAPTPTGAAEMAVPNIVDLQNNINQYKIRLNESIYKTINLKKLYLDSIKNSYIIKNPVLMYQNIIQKVETITDKLNTIMLKKINIEKINIENLKNNYIIKNPSILYMDKQKELSNIITKLNLLNPLNILDRGYNITYKDDHVVTSIKEINKTDKLSIKMKDGNVNVTVNEVIE